MDFDLNKLGEIADPFELDIAPRPAPALPPTPRISRGRTALACTAIALLWTAWLGREGLAPRPALSPTFVLCAVGLPVSVIVLAFAGFRHRGRLGLGLRLPILALIALVAAVGFVLSAFATQSTTPEVFTVQSTLSCVLTTSALAALPLLAGLALFRRTLVGNATARMLLFGLGCALLGTLLIRLHCPQESIEHLLLAHGVALPLFGLVGALLGQRQMSL